MPREGKLSEEFLQPGFVLGYVRIQFGIDSFEVSIGDDGGTSMPRAGDEDHVQIELFDQSIQMNIEEVQARSSPPVTQQARFDVVDFEGLFQEGIVIQIDLAD